MSQFERAYEIFVKACDLSDGERETFIRSACGSDLQLREHVASLLKLDQRSRLALDQIDDGGAGQVLVAQVNQDQSVSPGRRPTRIGRYQILDELGRGGMGVVYEAEQENPRRRVAVKVVRQGIESPEVVSRFRQEAQVLGHLRHPGIAQVFEAGAETVGDNDLPYLAMELITGQPLDRYARELPLNGRVELLARICDAVQHAHQKGIIHRDLKPANILVTREADSTLELDRSGPFADAIGQPKVMDFGIARLMDADERMTDVRTNAGQIIGTLAYMSPEQLDGDSSRLDTRCDVYALGVILYELLSGVMPYQLAGVPLAEAARIIQQEEPPPLGSRDRQLRGDLETIVSKAMDKDAERRYASAGELATDLRRYLRDEPILARPSSAMYQVRKFARRHRMLAQVVLGSTLALLMLLVGLIWQTIRVERQRDAANRGRQEAIESNRQLEQLLTFQTGMLREVDPQVLGQQIMTRIRRELETEATNPEEKQALAAAWSKVATTINPADFGRETLAENVLGPAMTELRRTFGDAPLLEASLRTSIARTLAQFGSHPESLAQHDLAYQLRVEELGEDDPDTLRSRYERAWARAQMGEYRPALAELREVFNRQTQVLGRLHADVADSSLAVAAAYAALDQEQEAEVAFHEALSIARTLWGEEALATREVELGYAQFLHNGVEHEQARQILEPILEQLADASGAEERGLLFEAQTLLGDVLTLLGKPREAMPLYAAASEGSRVLFGDDHPKTLHAMRELANGYRNVGSPRESADLTEQILASMRRTLGPSHPSTLIAILQLSLSRIELGDFVVAEALAREFLDRSVGVFGETDLKRPGMELTLVRALHGQGRFDEALELSTDLLARTEAREGEYLAIGRTLQVHAQILLDRDGLAAARPYYERALQQYQQGLGPTHFETVKTILDLGSKLVQEGQPEEAEQYLFDLLEALEHSQSADPIAIYRVLEELGGVLRAQQRYDEAEPFLLDALERGPQLLPGHWSIDRIRCLCGHTLLKLGESEQAVALLREGYEALSSRTADRPGPPGSAEIIEDCGRWLAEAEATQSASED